MKKTYLRAAIASLGLFTGTIFIDAQTAAGGAAAGGAAGGGAAAGGATAPSTATGAGAGRPVPGGSLNTVGASSVIQANPNNAASDLSRGGTLATPAGVPAASATAATTATTAIAPPVQFNTLPAPVQFTLQGFSANGSLGSVTAVPGQAGTFRASVVQNGVPMELTVAPNGRIISQAPITGSSASTPTASVAANPVAAPVAPNAPIAGTATPAFIPGNTVVPGGPLVMTDLPNTIQDAVRAQLGNNEASRIMQQRGANGVNYVVSYLQDGRPMAMVVGPDGRVLRNGPVTANVGVAAATSQGAAASSAEAATKTTVKLDELPNDVESALKQNAPSAEVRTITREQRVGGDAYVIAVRDGDRAGEIEIDENGKILRDTRRDISALTPSAPIRIPEEKQEGIPYDQVPVAIQNAIKAYATASDIRSIQLGLDRDGRTIFDVVFYRDGRRDRMIVNKQGRLVRIEQDVSPVFELASKKAPVLAIGDLPQKVQDTIGRQTDTVVVKDIQTKEVGGETVYQVNYSNTNGTPTELLVSQSGEVILPQGDRQNERAGAPLTADVDKAEPDPVRIVDATKPQADPNPTLNRSFDLSSTAAGAAASSERSNGSSSVSTTPGIVEIKELKLSDTPQPVQDTLKTMSGSGSVERITPRLGDSGITYEVQFMEGGKPRTVILDRNGAVQNQKEASAP